MTDKVCKVLGCQKKPKKGKRVCSMHIARKARYGSYDLTNRKHKTRKIDFVETKEGCFEPISHHTTNRFGYHTIIMNEKRMLMHRFIYEQCFGEIANGLVVRHKCDNPKCINPEHLEIGTPADNVKDMVERNRQAKGEKHGHSILTEKQVREIKKLLNKGVSAAEIARQHSVHRVTISKIKLGKAWKHVKIAENE